MYRVANAFGISRGTSTPRNVREFSPAAATSKSGMSSPQRSETHSMSPAPRLQRDRTRSLSPLPSVSYFAGGGGAQSFSPTPALSEGYLTRKSSLDPGFSPTMPSESYLARKSSTDTGFSPTMLRESYLAAHTISIGTSEQNTRKNSVEIGINTGDSDFVFPSNETEYISAGSQQCRTKSVSQPARVSR